MFGGFGLYASSARAVKGKSSRHSRFGRSLRVTRSTGSSFFGIIYRRQVYFKVHPGTKTQYTDRGMKPFRPSPGKTMSSYYEVPEEIVESAGQLAAWAREAAQKSRPTR